MTRPDLVIFDCDGVLVDTETLANHHLVKMLGASGYPITFEEARREPLRHADASGEGKDRG